jgi:serine/threonine-protein kinase
MTSVDVSETRPGALPSFDAGAFAPGTILSDRYRIVALAGRGGMGEVYRAEDLRLNQAVALKFLPSALERDDGARQRLLAEVRNARTVSHPNVCRVYDFGDVQGRYFLTMEYIDGEDLASLLRRIGRLPGDKVLEVARQLCAGIAAAHEKGVLHRDLKPSNVMIDGRGRARITDFGLAVEAGPATSPADFAGTVAYMAPERFHGTAATVQSDLYSLGLILYEACAGRPAFNAATIADWQRAHADSTPSRPSAVVPDVDPAVERTILRCLEKDPGRRPTSAMQVAAALPGGDPLAAAIAAGETPSPELVAASGEEGTLPRRMAWLSLAACAVAFLGVMLSGSWWSVASRVTIPHPELQRARAEQIVRNLGYADNAADDAWWVRQNREYLEHFRSTADRGRALATAATRPFALLFCYRRSPAPLLTSSGRVTDDDPPPRQPGDTYLELDTSGRLVYLRVVPSRANRPAAAPLHVDWSPLLRAAGVDASQMTPSEPEWGPADAFDTQAAWEGAIDGEHVRIEAAARHGRATYFSAGPSWMAKPADESAPTSEALPFFSIGTVVLFLGGFAFLTGLAIRNLRLGRGDRRGAYHLSAFMFVMLAVGRILSRHWVGVATAAKPEVMGTTPIVAQVMTTLGYPMFSALLTWLAYIGFEPYVRRRWPQLLIASARLLDGRWRDPLVGRSLLMGVFAAIAAVALVFADVALMREMGWGIVIPTSTPRGLDGLRPFVAYLLTATGIQVQFAIIYLAVLVLAGLFLRSAKTVWAAAVVLFFAFYSAWGSVFLGAHPAVVVTFALLFAATSLFVLWRNGVLTLVVWLVVVVALRDTPWTLALGSWYGWPTLFSTALIAAFALWGFRNVLGRQSAFPAG